MTSWAFVFGALATLLFTSLRPVWKDISGVEIGIEQVQGTMADVETTEPPVDTPVTAKTDCVESPTAEVPATCGERRP